MRLRGQRQVWLGIAMAAVAACCALALSPVSRDDRGDYAFVAHATGLGLDNAGIFIVLLFCAGLIAPEYGGVLRGVFVRPVLRHEYVLAKLLAGLCYAVAIMATVAGVAWGIVYAMGDRSGVTYGGELLYSHSEMLWTYFAGLAFSMFPWAAMVAFGVLVSACARGAVQAAAYAVGIWVALEAVKYPLRMDKYVFTTWLAQPMQAFAVRAGGAEFHGQDAWVAGGLISLASFAVFACGAIVALQRRNLTR